jgi:hypothetical protein
MLGFGVRVPRFAIPEPGVATSVRRVGRCELENDGRVLGVAIREFGFGTFGLVVGIRELRFDIPGLAVGIRELRFDISRLRDGAREPEVGTPGRGGGGRGPGAGFFTQKSRSIFLKYAYI